MPKILSIGTTSPHYSFSQDEFASFFTSVAALSEKQALFVRAICSRSAIKKRHIVLPDVAMNKDAWRLIDPAHYSESPSSYARNQVYKQEAPVLAFKAASKALALWGGRAKDITHVIAISCTGMMAPGLEFLLIKSLGLSDTVHRFGLNFMGCFGAFRGLELAAAFAKENSQARILVVSVELCSLHFQYSQDPGTMIGNILFADGGAAAVVGAQPQSFERPLWSIMHSEMHAFEGTQGDMTWEITNNGFLMRLLPSVPGHVKAYAPRLVKNLLGPIEISQCDWPIHPGGKAIIEGVEEALGLSRHDTRASWEILEEYGNMSSASMLFVLDRARHMGSEKKYAVSLGFGPGLSLEGLLLKKEF